MEKSQGLPMETIVIVVLIIIVLSGVGLIFYRVYGSGKTQIGSSTDTAQEGMNAFVQAAVKCHGKATFQMSCSTLCEGTDCDTSTYVKVLSCSYVGCQKGQNGVCSGNSVNFGCDAINDKTTCATLGCNWVD